MWPCKNRELASASSGARKQVDQAFCSWSHEWTYLSLVEELNRDTNVGSHVGQLDICDARDQEWSNGGRAWVVGNLKKLEMWWWWWWWSSGRRAVVLTTRAWQMFGGGGLPVVRGTYCR